MKDSGLYLPSYDFGSLVLPVAHYKISGEVQCFVVDGKTKEVVRTFPKQKNLILNRFMEGVALRDFENNFRFAVASTGSKATVWDSTSQNASQTGSTVTLDAGAFSFDDTQNESSSIIGNTIKWVATGEERKIIARTSGTVVTVSADNNADVAAGRILVYGTNQATMNNTVNEKRGGNGVAGSSYLNGACGTDPGTSSGPAQVIFTRTYDFAVEATTARDVAHTPYAELGWSDLSTVGGANVNSRVLLTVPVPVAQGQQLRVAYKLTVGLSPWPATVVGTNVVNGWVSTGRHWIQRQMLTQILTSGGAQPYTGGGGVSPLEPNLTGIAVVGLTTVGGGTPTNWNVDGIARTFADPLGSANNRFKGFGSVSAKPKYITAGTGEIVQPSANALYADKIFSWGSGEGNNAAWAAMILGYDVSGSGPYNANAYSYVYLLDTPQQKDSLHSLEIRIRFTWSRVLS